MKPTHVLTITIPIDAGDSPEVRGRCRNLSTSIGSNIPRAAREAVEECLGDDWLADRYGIPKAQYRSPKVGRVTVRITGPSDTFEGG